MNRYEIIDIHGNVRPVPPGERDLSKLLKDGERLRTMFIDEQWRDPFIFDATNDPTRNIFGDADTVLHAARVTAAAEYKRRMSDAWRHDGAAQRIKSAGETIEDARRDYLDHMTNAWRNPR